MGAEQRVTNGFWKSCGSQLRAMVEHPDIGPPTFFVTLTAADLYWATMQQAFGPEQESELLPNATRRQRFFQRAQSIRDDPMTAAYYFYERMRYFVHEILMRKFRKG